MSWTRENYRTYMRVRILAKARGLDDTRHDPVDSPRSPQKDRPAMSLVLELPGGLKVLADNPVALAALIAQLTPATVPGISLLPPARVDVVDAGAPPRKRGRPRGHSTTKRLHVVGATTTTVHTDGSRMTDQTRAFPKFVLEQLAKAERQGVEGAGLTIRQLAVVYAQKDRVAIDPLVLQLRPVCYQLQKESLIARTSMTYSLTTKGREHLQALAVPA